MPYVTVSPSATYKFVVDDLNGDGRADMVDNGVLSGLHVRYSNADGTFQAPIFISLSSVRANGLALADLNADGRKDIIATRTGTTTSQVAVVMNSATGFGTASLLTMSSFVPSGVVLVGDLNGDTRPDLMIPATSTYIFYFVQSSTGVMPTTYSGYSSNTIVNASYGDVSDFNKDGRPDIVLATTTQYQVSTHSGSSASVASSLVWTPQTAVPLTTIAGLKAADLNVDTNPDVLVRANSAGYSALGTGTGSFGAGTAFAFPGSSPILPVDLNADGRLDLVSGGSSSVYIALASAPGVWPTPTNRQVNAPGTVQTVVATGQLIGSAAPEIFTAPQSSSTIQVSILVNEGAGLFPGAKVSGSSSTNAAAATGDVDGDGDRDLVVSPAIATGGTGTGSILLGSNDGSFGAAVSTVALRGDELALGRLNADSFADLVASIESSTTPGVDVFLGGAGGTFSAPVRLATAGLPTRVLIANIDGDSNADVVVGTSSGLEWFRGNGDGTFTTARVALTGQGAVQALAVADLNMDGKVDLLVNSGTTTGSLKVLLGYGMGAFSLTPFVSPSTSLTVTDISSADFDRDGRPDVAVGSGSGVLLFKGDGNGLLQQQTTQSTLVGRLAVVDLDNDGLQDLVTNNGEVVVSRGQGTGFSFLAARAFVPGRTLVPGALIVDKLNADSFRDVLVLSTNSEIWAYLGVCR